MLPEAHDPFETELPLLDLLGFDAALEAEGLRRLGEMDLPGCREAFARLVQRLTLQRLGGHGREGVLLLHNMLQRVAARMHNTAAEDYAAVRVALLRQFAPLEDPEEARALFLPALDRLLRSGHLPTPAAPSLVQRAATLIEESYAERLSLSCVAARLHVSPAHLSRVFRRQTGSTLTEYVHRTRLRHARRLLEEGGRTICEVAYLVGYQNYRDFYRNFTKHESVSPGEVRRRGTGGL
ncbi:MAG TPA: helix-turn-helix domain-containing protein [Candidatus Polarisedimenticolaceae bacterium]|nr:helix-turn-helix domain-containing protein [Candidatus Polarisedimenticolaceae bacterium]